MAKKTPAKHPAKKAPKSSSPKKTAAEKPLRKTAAGKKSVRPAKLAGDGMEIALMLASGMAEKKAADIRILDMRKLAGAPADYFVISHATSGKQVEAIASSAEEEVRKTTSEHPWHREGYENLEWVLLDYVNVVAHVFLADKREFYGVEELWGDAELVPFKE